jgi:hypothetical protein
MNILRAKAEHIIYAKQISLCIDESAKVRGTGIARRTPEYLATKIENGLGPWEICCSLWFDCCS